MKYMKYIFAASLVLLALVMVFHIEKLVPIPGAIGQVIGSWLDPILPFDVKTAYADSCITGMEAKQGQVQYAISESSVRLKELDHHIACWQQQLESSVVRLRVLVNAPASSESIGREVQRHDELQSKITHAQNLRSRFQATIASLEKSEGEASRSVSELRNRLEIVKLDHERNDAQELAAAFSGTTIPGRSTLASHGVKTVQALEHEERVREEWHRRYGPEGPGEVAKDALQRAKEIIEQEDPNVL